MGELVIVGASGHGKVVADIAIKVGYSEIVFLDDAEGLVECAGFPVVGKVSDALSRQGSDFVVAIGDPLIRERIQKGLSGTIVALVHPDACISRRVDIGKGSVVMAGAVVNSDTTIGEGCIVNTGATVDHDCFVGDFAHVSVGAHVAGAVGIGRRVWLGIGSAVSNNVHICDESIVGAGSVVVMDIDQPGTYVGVPAKMLHGY